MLIISQVIFLTEEIHLLKKFVESFHIYLPLDKRTSVKEDVCSSGLT